VQPGQTVASYRILEAVDHGSTCGIYTAYDGQSKAVVALKVLFPELSRSEPPIRRFQREAESLKRMSHPNVIAFIDAGFGSNCYFVALEHIVGTTVARLLEEGPLAPDLCVKLMLQLTEAVAHAHERGILHGDINPHDVMVTEDGLVRLIDFGSTEGDAGGFRPQYASPERNQGHDVDERSDLYSLGLLFFELLVGRRALPGTSLFELTCFQMRHPIPSVHGLDSRIPRSIDAIVARLTERDRTARFQSARELLAALRVSPEPARDSPSTAAPVVASASVSKRRFFELVADEGARHTLAAQEAEKQLNRQ